MKKSYKTEFQIMTNGIQFRVDSRRVLVSVGDIPVHNDQNWNKGDKLFEDLETAEKHKRYLEDTLIQQQEVWKPVIQDLDYGTTNKHTER